MLLYYYWSDRDKQQRDDFYSLWEIKKWANELAGWYNRKAKKRVIKNKDLINSALASDKYFHHNINARVKIEHIEYLEWLDIKDINNQEESCKRRKFRCSFCGKRFDRLFGGQSLGKHSKCMKIAFYIGKVINSYHRNKLKTLRHDVAATMAMSWYLGGISIRDNNGYKYRTENNVENYTRIKECVV